MALFEKMFGGVVKMAYICKREDIYNWKNMNMLEKLKEQEKRLVKEQQMELTENKIK